MENHYTYNIETIENALNYLRVVKGVEKISFLTISNYLYVIETKSLSFGEETTCHSMDSIIEERNKFVSEISF